jgi:hypothetical protein
MKKILKRYELDWEMISRNLIFYLIDTIFYILSLTCQILSYKSSLLNNQSVLSGGWDQYILENQDELCLNKRTRTIDSFLFHLGTIYRKKPTHDFLSQEKLKILLDSTIFLIRILHLSPISEKYYMKRSFYRSSILRSQFPAS